MNQHIPKYLSLPDVNAAAPGKGRIYFIAAFLLMGLLFLPMENLAGAHCTMEEQGQAEQPVSNDDCCPFESENPEPDCTSCEICNCYFAPFSGHHDSSFRDATLQHTLKFAIASSHEVPARSMASLQIKPAAKVADLPPSVPVYLANQVFLN